MSTIPPSLSQVLLGRPAATPASATQAKTADAAARFGDALSAQKAFFRQATGQATGPATGVDQPAPKPAGTVPATFRAADIAQASASGANSEAVRTLRPGSLLNIRV